MENLNGCGNKIVLLIMASTEHNTKIRNHPVEKDGYIIPSHYVDNKKLQTIDILETQLTKDQFKGFCKGIILKYLIREDESNKTRSLIKAKYYLDELISFLSETEKKNEKHLKPTYYRNSKLGMETIDIIEDQLPKEELVGFYQAMVIKYILRSSYKNHFLDDMIKAKYYLDREINYLKEGK